MITEKGTIKTSVKHDENMYNELNRNLRIAGIVSIVVGAIALVLAALVLGVSIYEGTEEVDTYVMFVLGAALLALGIIYIVIYKNAAKAALKMNRVGELEFFGDYLIEREYTDGELTSTVKVYYKWLVRIRETKNYLFLYNTRVTAMAVDKNSLPISELNTVRMLLGRPAVGAAQAPVQVPAQSVENPTAVDVPPEEPFKDLTDNKEE